MTLKKISELEKISAFSNNSNIIIEEGGIAKRISASLIGSSGGSGDSSDNNGDSGNSSVNLENVPMYVDVTTFNIDADVFTSSMVGTATGWSTSGNSFTHSSGSKTPLSIAMGSLAVAGEEWLITFDCTSVTSDILFLSFGDEALTKVYNGLTSFAVALRVKANSDNLLITPASSFAGTITNFQIRKITETGTEQYVYESNSIYNMDGQVAKTGFWNVALGTEHTFHNSLNSSRTIAIGHGALGNLCTGMRNIGIGTFALQQLNDGEDNLAIGADSMAYLDTAENCTAFGVKSLVGYTDRIVDSVAIGTSSGHRGNQLTAIGSYAGCSNTGDDNTFIGCRAGAYVTSGSRNIIIGSYVEGQPTGNFNTIIGRGANYPNGATNCVAIGRNAICTESNQVMIGSSDTTTSVVLGGKKLVFNEDGTVSWTQA